MKRRNFIAAAGAAGLLSACGQKQDCDSGNAQAATTQEAIQWSLVTTWPPGFQGLGTGAERLADLIGKLTNGRITVKVYGANELVPALQVFDAVSSGSVRWGTVPLITGRENYPLRLFLVLYHLA